MSVSTPPKGSLEELFRHHLLESEAAAVPPRPHVWEQLDNSLLLAQNAQYRRRLRVHRWAVAASLLLATLAGGGWWHSQQLASGPALTQAAHQASATGAAVPNGYGQPLLAGAARPAGSYAPLAAAGTTPAGSVLSPLTTYAIDQTATSSSTRAGAARRGYAAAGGRSAAAHRGQFAGAAAASPVLAAYASQASAKYRRAGALPAWWAAGAALHSTTTEVNGARSYASPLAATTVAAVEPATASLAAVSLAHAFLAGAAQPAGALATRTVPLALASGAGLPSHLGELPLAERPLPTLARRWQFGLAYSASAYQPNIDFTKQTTAYNQALGTSSAFATQSAAAEYRSHLRAGLGQRLSLWATRRLGSGRFGLRTGLEVAQNMAYSASSVAFVGEQVADFSYTNAVAPSIVAPHLQNTSYRYRTASVPVELRYGNPAKPGFSLYGRLGGLVTALLNVRSDVEGSPEATRTYSLTSASSPYRHLSANLRGAAGVHYQPAGRQWGLSLGPVAEAGILSLNADPVQDFWSQKRPYSFGLEAGVELGRAPRVP